MARQPRDGTLFDRLKVGLEEGIRHARGELKLRATEVPTPESQTPLTSAEIRRVRRAARMSQPAFARVLNVSQQAVKDWERGESRPTQAALRLLQVIRAHPAIVTEILDWDQQLSLSAS